MELLLTLSSWEDRIGRTMKHSDGTQILQKENYIQEETLAHIEK